MSTSDKGKWAEKEAANYLAVRAKRLCFAFHRYPDSKAARGALAAQPADYLVTRSSSRDEAVVYPWGKVTHLEVKETQELNRIPKDKVRQYGKLRMFWLAGIDVALLVYRSSHKDWVVFRPKDLFDYEECPASFPFVGCKVYRTAADALDEVFP